MTVSAGIARNYDAAYLPRHPHLLLLPAVASLMTSSLIFYAVQSLYRRHGGELASYWKGYWQFLGLFWMTAPLAWLYAIPVERWLDAKDAMIANLWLLAVVALWRVLLTIRVVRVVYGLSRMASTASVGIVSAIVTFFALVVERSAVVRVMGGIRMSEQEQLLVTITGFGMCVSGILLILCICMYVIAARRPSADIATHPRSIRGTRGRPLIMIAIAAVLVPVPFVVGFQRAQSQLAAFDNIYRQQGRRAYIDAIANRGRDALPPQFDPFQDRIHFGTNAVALFNDLESQDAPDWIRESAYRGLSRLRHGFRGEVVLAPEFLLLLRDMNRLNLLDETFRERICKAVQNTKSHRSRDQNEFALRVAEYLGCLE